MRNIPQVHSQVHSQAQKSLDPAANGADESCADECADTPGTDNPADHWSIHLPGFELTHIVHLASVANLDVVSRVAARLKDHETSVANFAVSRSGDLLDQKIVLRDIGERSAEALREALLVLDGVLRARVEHRFVRAGAKR